MNRLSKIIFIISLILLLIPGKGFSQDLEQKNPSNDQILMAAKEIMTAASTCALITLDEEGRPRARAMDPFDPENDFTVWFGTNANSRKVDQIKADPRVTLYYLDSDASGYVMIHGNAQLVDDKEEKEKRWKDEWEAFYPDKTEDYLLIKVSPIWMEVSSTPRGIFSDTITWQPPIILFDSEE